MLEKLESLANRIFPNYRIHGWAGKVLLIGGLVIYAIVGLCGAILIIAALDFSKWLQVPLAFCVISVGVWIGRACIRRANSTVRAIPLGWGAEIRTPTGEYLVSNASDGVWVCDLTGKAHLHTLGDKVKLHDMRTSVLEVSHFDFASDGVGVSIRAGVFWRIWDLNRYLNVTRTPTIILEDSIHRHLTHFIHRNAGADVAKNTQEIEKYMTCATNLECYGITIDGIQIIAVDAHCHSTPLPNPAPQPTAIPTK